MSANVESMFWVRKVPWHGLGKGVKQAPNSEEALSLAGLDWKVVQEPIITATGDLVEGYKAKSADFICGKYNWDKIVQETIKLYQG